MCGGPWAISIDRYPQWGNENPIFLRRDLELIYVDISYVKGNDAKGGGER